MCSGGDRGSDSDSGRYEAVTIRVQLLVAAEHVRARDAHARESHVCRVRGLVHHSSVSQKISYRDFWGQGWPLFSLAAAREW